MLIHTIKVWSPLPWGSMMQKAEEDFKKPCLQEKAPQDTRTISSSLCWVL